MNTVAIRTDASALIGIGHVMRCLTLMQKLRSTTSVHVVFICNSDLPEALNKKIQGLGFELKLVSSRIDGVVDDRLDAMQTAELLVGLSVDWLVVDHYGLDARWERSLKAYVRKIFVIDDLANRLHECNAILDQNLYSNMDTRYNPLLNEGCRLFLGPSFLLLRDEFYSYYKNHKHSGTVQQILVNFGGSDPTGEIGKLLEGIKIAGGEINKLHFHIVAGPANEKRELIRQSTIDTTNVTYYEQVNMAEILSQVDLAVGAGGITMWERCFMGVPSAVITVADNQIEPTKEAERLGLIWNLGESSSTDRYTVIDFLHSISSNFEEVCTKSDNALLYMRQLRDNINHPIVEFMKEE
ncbi:UDP-2,4-diacetamido-2,4,6-trideoxy-beta-L-altropyranose hydrolase [Paenibacillus stellifer]|uniref:UDP-2,4-diacetamido-2,4, 6-trideoxy-beta-L-altropyranose hydrolase n=1 Tax=Paenibacillus stellifer TaxID=169760 RepID=UPI0006908A72|nr:UDP-2,4-diacetamido-2,4,6-trideoxy-beta-L-altropyranose hydrolase [Paenibacillus stellifer]